MTSYFFDLSFQAQPHLNLIQHLYAFKPLRNGLYFNKIICSNYLASA